MDRETVNLLIGLCLLCVVAVLSTSLLYLTGSPIYVFIIDHTTHPNHVYSDHPTLQVPTTQVHTPTVTPTSDAIGYVNVQYPSYLDNYVLNIMLYNTSGTSNGNTIYLGDYVSNWNDLVFRSADDSVEYPYWVEPNKTCVNVWVNVTDGASSFGIYYNNSKVVGSDPHAVFPFYDDFNDTARTDWTTT